MRTWRSLFLYATSFSTDVIGFIGVLIVWVICGTNLRFEKKSTMFNDQKPPPGNWALTCDVKKNRAKWWKYNGMTISPHAIIYREGVRYIGVWSRVQEHEHFHCEQYESASIIGAVILVVGLFGPIKIFLSFFIWTVSPWAYMGGAYLAAWLRGEDIYRGAHTEEGAYAIDDFYED